MRDTGLKNPARPLPKQSDKRQTAPRGIRRHGLKCNYEDYLRLRQNDEKQCMGHVSATGVADLPQLACLAEAPRASGQQALQPGA